MPAVAVDIGTYSIKFVHGTPGQKPAIKDAGESFNSLGVSVPTDDIAVGKLSTLIQSVFTEYKLPVKDVRLSVPDSVVSTKVIQIPSLTDAELAGAINFQAEQHIPIPPDDLNLEYQVLYRPKKNTGELMSVLLVGVRKQLIERYLEIFHQAGIEPMVLESQMLSVIRALDFVADDPPTLVAHIGASSLSMTVISHMLPTLVLTHLSGGQLLNKSLEQAFGLDPSQAEQYKCTFGLDDSQLEGKVKAALLPALSVMVNELRKLTQYHAQQFPSEPIRRVVITGGSAALPGISQYLSAELSVEVLAIDPFASTTGSISDKLNRPSMVVCMGLLKRT